MTVVVGREDECKTLSKLYKSVDPQFIAVYGRRRVGKTYLIREFYAGKGLYFEITGIKNGKLKNQLKNFTNVFSEVFYPGLKLNVPSSWGEAFELLTQELKKLPASKKVTVFIDELPWLSTKRSMLLENLEYFWNTKWSLMKNFTLVVCGSAAAWMLDKIINARGGLHNRLTKTILLEPFTLKQTVDFLKSQHIKLSHSQLLELYMVMGGVPYYLKSVENGRSAAQIINQLCFHKNGLLFNEFNNLFTSLFDAAELNMSIIRAVSKVRSGISRNELLETLKMSSGGVFNARINELVSAGFLQRFVPYGKKSKDQYYRVIDEYTIFYLKWIEPYTINPRALPKNGHWQKIANSPAWKSWSGYAFEEVCYKHINQIANALDLQHTSWISGTWRKKDDREGAQVDLLFDRDDGVISIVEIRHSQSMYEIDKKIAMELIKKLELFKKFTDTKKDLQLVMLVSNGIKPNVWFKEVVSAVVTLEDLMKE